MPEDVESGLVSLLPGLPGTPPPVRTWRKAVFFLLFTLLNEQEIHMSFIPGRNPPNPCCCLRFSERKRSSWVYLYFGNFTFCRILVRVLFCLQVQNTSSIFSLSINRSGSNLTQLASCSLDDYLPYTSLAQFPAHDGHQRGQILALNVHHESEDDTFHG